MSEWWFQVQPTAQTLIHFSRETASRAGRFSTFSRHIFVGERVTTLPQFLGDGGTKL